MTPKDRYQRPRGPVANTDVARNANLTEHALQVSLRRYQDLVETIEEWIWELDLTGVYTYVSPRVRDMLGYEPEELIGKKPFEFMPPEEARRIQPIIEAMFAAQKTFNDLENVNLRKDGRPVVLSTSGKPFFTPDGKLAGYRGLDRDITARKMAEEELWRSEQRFRDTFEQAAVGIAHVDVQGKFIRINQRFSKILDYEVNELLAMDFREITPAEDQAGVEIIFQSLMSGERAQNTVEKKLVRKGGTKIWVNLTVSPIHNERGKTRYLIAVVEDITPRKDAETALRMTNFTIENATDALYWIDSAGRIFHVNEVACRHLGYTREELLSMTVQDIDADVTFENWPVIWNSIKEKRSDVIEMHHITRDGRLIPVEIAGNYMEFDGKEYISAFARDISERARTQQELEKTQALLTAAIEQTPAGILVADAPDGTIRLANRAALNIRGASEHFLTNIPIESHPESWQTFHPDGTPFEPAELPLSRAILEGVTVRNVEALIRRPDGEDRLVLANAAPVRNSDGEVVAGVVVFPDITEHRQEEAARLLLETAIEQSADSVVVTDTDGTILYVNPAFEKSSGFGREEVIGQNPRIQKSGQHEDVFYDQMWQHLARGEDWSGQITNRHKDGSLYEEVATISPVRNSQGAVTHFVAVKRDITEMVKLESQLRHSQKLEAIGTLTGGLAHDFNNIIYAVLGFTQLAMDDLDKDSVTYKNLSEVMRAGDRASDLVRQMLTFSRRGEQQRRPLRLQPVIKDALKLVKGTLPSTIEIQEKIKPECGPVMADVTQIHQVILNLCTNAAHAMGAGGGMLEVGLDLVDIEEETGGSLTDLAPGPYTVISIRDSGHGMDESTLERIFEPYFTTKKQHEGTGLGLSTVHGIVQGSEGAISVESEVGKGTLFQVFLPQCEIQAVTQQSGSSTGSLQESQGRILVVDDEAMIVNMVTSSLERIGCKVVPHVESNHALEEFQSEPDGFDLVITDLTMPGMTGLDLAREILRIRPDVPIILTTGYSEGIDPDEVKSIGIKEYLLKPVRLRELEELVSTIMNKDDHSEAS